MYIADFLSNTKLTDACLFRRRGCYNYDNKFNHTAILSANINKYVEKNNITKLVFFGYTYGFTKREIAFISNVNPKKITEIYFIDVNIYEMRKQIDWFNIFGEYCAHIYFINSEVNATLKSVPISNKFIIENPKCFVNDLLKIRGKLSISLIDKLKYQIKSMQCEICFDTFDEMEINCCCLSTICFECAEMTQKHNFYNCAVCKKKSAFIQINNAINVDEELNSIHRYQYKNNIYTINTNLEFIFYHAYINNGDIDINIVCNQLKMFNFDNPLILFRHESTFEMLNNICENHEMTKMDIKACKIEDIEYYSDCDAFFCLDPFYNGSEIDKLVRFTNKITIMRKKNILIYYSNAA
jgi:hypothetical protein